jgi:hypothetical protein
MELQQVIAKFTVYSYVSQTKTSTNRLTLQANNKLTLIEETIPATLLLKFVPCTDSLRVSCTSGSIS